MFVIMSYDVEAERAAKVLKVARKYLFHVQRSLFQGNLTEKQLRNLKKELAALIVPEADKLVFYKSFNDSMLQVDEIGIANNQDMIL